MHFESILTSLLSSASTSFRCVLSLSYFFLISLFRIRNEQHTKKKERGKKLKSCQPYCPFTTCHNFQYDTFQIAKIRIRQDLSFRLNLSSSISFKYIDISFAMKLLASIGFYGDSIIVIFVPSSYPNRDYKTNRGSLL